MKPDVFISYNKEDAGQTVQLCKALRRWGFTPWVDRQGIGGGDDWLRSLVDAAENTPVMVMMLGSQASYYQGVEFGIALTNKVKVIPLVLEGRGRGSAKHWTPGRQALALPNPINDLSVQTCGLIGALHEPTLPSSAIAASNEMLRIARQASICLRKSQLAPQPGLDALKERYARFPLPTAKSRLSVKTVYRLQGRAVRRLMGRDRPTREAKCTMYLNYLMDGADIKFQEPFRAAVRQLRANGATVFQILRVFCLGIPRVRTSG